MNYYIRNNVNTKLTLNQLDIEACEFWRKAVEKHSYAFPEIKTKEFDSIKDEFEFYSTVVNWNEKILFGLLYVNVEQYAEVSWDIIIDNLLKFFTEEERSNTEFEEFVKNDPDVVFIGGYWKLFEHWKEKGYKLYYVN